MTKRPRECLDELGECQPSPKQRKKEKMKSDPEAFSSGNSANVLPLVDNKLNECNYNTYKSGGIKNSQHGILFQAKISMLLASSSIDRVDFKMAAEMEAADKFDDFVIILTGQNDSTVVLVQAKHRLYPKRDKIKYQDLFKIRENKYSKIDFSLIKYFLSYNKVIREPLFKDKEKQFFICTNTSFDLTKFPEGVLSSAQDIEREHIFYIEDTLSEKSRGKMHKIIGQNSSFIKEFIEILLRIVLIQIKNNRSLKKLFKKDPKQKEFYSKLNNTEEYNGSNYWNEIKNQLHDKLSGSNQNRTDDVNKTLGELLGLVNLISNNDVLRQRIYTFFERMVIITDYPDETRLTNILKQKLISKPEIQQFVDWLDRDLFYNSWQQDVFDWHHKFKDAEKKLAEFIRNEDWKQLINYWLNKCINMSVSSISRAETEKIKTLSIEFNHKLRKFTKFLDSEEQVCYLITNNPRLGTVKTLKYLTEPHNMFTFSPFNNIKVDKLRELILRSFSSASSTHLLVIECPQVYREENKEQLICHEIAEILKENKRKKVIIISSTEFSLGTSLINCFSGRKIQVDDSFKDLTPYSQNTILVQTKILFQGKQVVLSDLMENSLASKVINQSELLGLLEGKISEVGYKLIFNSAGCKKSCYVTRYFYQQIELNNDTFVGSEKYFISGLSKNMLRKLGIKGKIYEEEENWTCYNNGIILYTQKLSKNDPCYDFSCETAFKECEEINLSKGIKVKRLLYDKKSKEWKILVREVALAEKVLVIAGDSGIGKSTVLTKIAIGIKKQDLSHWVIRINLNDFADKTNANSLDRIDFEDHERDKAVPFLADMVFPNKLHGFQKKLLKETLDGHEGSKLKIFLMFDGFDEIVPAYKEKSLKLIKAVKMSNVSQIIVTTRLGEMQYLEQKLETQAWSIAQFTSYEQVEYLNRYLHFKLSPKKSNIEYLQVRELLKKLNKVELLPINGYPDPKPLRTLVFKKSDFKKNFDDTSRQYEEMLKNFEFSHFSLALIQKWKCSINEADKFVCVPLLLYMLAEGMNQEKFPSDNRLGIPELYDLFINMKFEIYKNEKKKQICVTQATENSDIMLSYNFEKVYCMLAFNNFFPNNSVLEDQNKEIKEFESQLKENNIDLYREISRAGIVTFLDSNNLQFIHRSFAEYYLSKCLCKYLGSRPGIQQLFVKEILPNQSYLNLLEFINSQLLKEKIKLSEVLDIINKYHLFTAINRNVEGIVLFLLSCLKERRDPNTNIIQRVGTVLHRTSKTSFFLNILDWLKQNLSQVEFNKLLLTKNRSRATFFWDFISSYVSNKEQILEFLQTNLGLNIFIKQLILECDSQDKSEFILDYIMNTLDDINSLSNLFLLRDKRNFTLLHASANSYTSGDRICDILNYLKNKIKHVPKKIIFMKNNKQQTFLQVFVKLLTQFICSYNEEHKCTHANDLMKILKFLKCYLDPNEYEKLLLAEDQDGENIIHDIVRIRCSSLTTREFAGSFVLELFDYLREESSSLFNKLILSRNNKQQTILHIIVISCLKYFNTSDGNYDCDDIDDSAYVDDSADKDYSDNAYRDDSDISSDDSADSDDNAGSNISNDRVHRDDSADSDISDDSAESDISNVSGDRDNSDISDANADRDHSADSDDNADSNDSVGSDDVNNFPTLQYLRTQLDESKWHDLLDARDDKENTIFHIIFRKNKFSLLKGLVRSLCLNKDHYEELIKIKNNVGQTSQDLITSEDFHLSMLSNGLFDTQKN